MTIFYSEHEQHLDLKTWLYNSNLDNRKKCVLIMRAYGYTFKEIGARFKVHQVRACQLYYNALFKVRKNMEREENRLLYLTKGENNDTD